ncbi:hypothetical protein JOB18_031928 [Solea senegalensis]|uniref:Uncharacterized protein n=1 Tax=Solea senegalensis TaxID=28829 RepID=A0AAV6RXA7_SOLSE|nr:hypothetical protein JOB18_031928 [Solea senegalensis]
MADRRPGLAHHQEGKRDDITFPGYDVVAAGAWSWEDCTEDLSIFTSTPFTPTHSRPVKIALPPPPPPPQWLLPVPPRTHCIALECSGNGVTLSYSRRAVLNYYTPAMARRIMNVN